MKRDKRKYEKPVIQVFSLYGHTMLLAGSGLNDPDDYNNGGNPFTF